MAGYTSGLSYPEALSEAGIVTLFDRREFLTDKSFNDIVNDTGHKLHGLLPSENQFDSNLRAKNTFNVPILVELIDFKTVF